MRVGRRVVHEVLERLLSERRLPLRARRGRRRMSLVLGEALAVGGDMASPVAAGLRAGSLTGGWRCPGRRGSGGAALGHALGGSICCVHLVDLLITLNARAAC